LLCALSASSREPNGAADTVAVSIGDLTSGAALSVKGLSSREAAQAHIALARSATSRALGAGSSGRVEGVTGLARGALCGTGAAEARSATSEALTRLLGRQGLEGGLGSSGERSLDGSVDSGQKAELVADLVVLVDHNGLGGRRGLLGGLELGEGSSKLIEVLNDDGTR
jgi:hypothetical protein